MSHRILLAHSQAQPVGVPMFESPEFRDGYATQVYNYAHKLSVPEDKWKEKSDDWKEGYAYGEMEVRKDK